MGRGAREVKVLVMLVTIPWAEIANLPEVVTESKRRSLFQIEALLPDLGLVHDLELDMLFQILRTHLLGETCQHCFSRPIDQCLPVLFRACVEVSNGNKNIQGFLSLG